MVFVAPEMEDVETKVTMAFPKKNIFDPVKNKRKHFFPFKNHVYLI
jgi:hypothetical protein